MLKNRNNSLDDRSAGSVDLRELEYPNITFIQDLKKNVGPSRYKSTIRVRHITGKKSKKKLKNKNSEMKNMDPGKPKKTNIFSRDIMNSLLQLKFRPLISVTRRVLNRLDIASTIKKEFVEIKA